MARVIPGDYNPTNLRRRGIFSSKFGSTTYYYRTKKTKPNKYKSQKITDFTPRNEKVELCNKAWTNLPPCRKDAIYSIIDSAKGITAYDYFMLVCTTLGADDLSKWIREFENIHRCWCIHPRDQALNPYHTSSCLYMKVKDIPPLKFVPVDFHKLKEEIGPFETSKIQYVYNKCIPHVDWSQSPDGFRSHWGGIRMWPDKKIYDWTSQLGSYTPHYHVDEFTLKTDIGIGLYKPPNTSYRIAFDGYPEFIVNWIPIEFKRATFPYDHYNPWDRDYIYYDSLNVAGPFPEAYNGILAVFTPPEHKISLCKNNQITLYVYYRHDHVKWNAVGSTKEPYFYVYLWGQKVAVLGTGGGKLATAAGEIRNPTEGRIVPMNKETIDQGSELQNIYRIHGKIIEAKKQSTTYHYRGNPDEGWLDEIVYVFKFPEPVYFDGFGKYPWIRIDARTPTETSPPCESETFWNRCDAHASFYPGYDPFGWYWYRDNYGPRLKKGVNSYCFPYKGYYNGFRETITIRYAVSLSPLGGSKFKGGGIDSVKVLVLKCAGKDMGPNPNKLLDCIKKNTPPPPPPPKE